jgi:hypothetical protein
MIQLVINGSASPRMSLTSFVVTLNTQGVLHHWQPCSLLLSHQLHQHLHPLHLQHVHHHIQPHPLLTCSNNVSSMIPLSTQH